MQGNDLATWDRPRNVVILEGVLATVREVVQSRRFRGPKHEGYALDFHPVPLKRCATMKRNWPDVALDVITFISPEVCEDAAGFLLDAHVPIDSTQYHKFEKWTATLPYQPDIHTVYDSDPYRLDHYGQQGKAVLRGEDF